MPDCTKAAALIAGFVADHLLADRGHDTNSVISQAKSQRMKVVTPAKSSRKEVCSYDKACYTLCSMIENSFLHLKRWHGIATRYAKQASSLLAAIQIRCTALWANSYVHTI